MEFEELPEQQSVPNAAQPPATEQQVAFDNTSSLIDDDCYVLGQCVRNNRAFEYLMYSTMDPYCESNQDQRVAALSFETMRHEVKSALTPRACDIDAESAIMRAAQSSCVGRTQLNPRMFVAVPDLRKGVPEPDVESQLQQGSYQLPRRACDKDGRQNDPFAPLLPCVENWVSQLAATQDAAITRPGMPTRQDENLQKFLADTGYARNERGVWFKRPCGAKPSEAAPEPPPELRPYDVGDSYEVY